MKDTAKILSSWSTGSVANANDRVGGLVGHGTDSGVIIRESWSSMAIVAAGNAVAGLVGEMDGRILYSHSTASLSTTSDEIGGLVGDMDNSNAGVTDSYARGSISLRGSSSRAGGLVGNIDRVDRTIKRSFSTVTVGFEDTSLSANMGAIAGGSGATVDPNDGTRSTAALSGFTNVSNNFFNSSVSTTLLGIANTTGVSDEAAIGRVTGLPATQLNSFTTFHAAGWAIVDGWAPFNAPDDNVNPVQGTHQVWGICSGVNDGYPYLLWQYTSNPCPSAAPGVASPAIHLDLKAKGGDVVAGAPVLIEGQGLQSGSTYSLVMRSTPTTVTTGTVTGGGRFSTTVNLPAGIAPGNHTITLTAIGSDGSKLSLVTTFVVSSAGTFTSISPGVGSVAGGLAATGPNSSALSLGVASSLALLALGLAAFASTRRKAARVS